MYLKIKKCPNSQSLPNALCISLALRLIIVVLPLLLCSTGGVAKEFYSGNQYTYTAIYNENYIYKWSASFGSYQENDKNTFIWIAPDVNTPSDVVVSVFVTDRTCGCYSNFDKVITVLPREETKLETESISNSTNSTQINDSIVLLQILTNNTKNSKLIMPIGNDTKLGSASESLENATKLVNLTSDAISGTKSRGEETTIIKNLQSEADANVVAEEPAKANALSQDDSSQAGNQAEAAETPSGMESATIEPADEGDSSDTSEAIQLTFDDGTQVDVTFAQDSSGICTANVMSEDKGVESATGAGGSENSAPQEDNSTQLTEPVINETVEKTDQAQETVPSAEEFAADNASVDSSLPTQRSSELAGDQSVSMVGSADQSAAEVPSSDAAASAPQSLGWSAGQNYF